MRKRVFQLSWLKRIFPFVLAAAIFCAVIFYPNENNAAVETKRIIRIWNVDTFEGGKGSRTSFLKKVALRAEKTAGEVYYLVSSYTLDGAKDAFLNGDKPDILSFGTGLSVFAEYSIPLDYSFGGGETENGCLAYPWCRGGYALFSLDENFDDEGVTAVSCGGNNLSALAAAYHEIDGLLTDSLAAYTGLLSGKYRYLLGTQRDLCRFAARNTAVYYRPLPTYCDLYQYISVLSVEHKDDCDAFLRELFSDEVQSMLSEIGMYSMTGNDDFIAGNVQKTVSAFISDDSLKKLAEAAANSDLKTAENFLKNI